MKQPTKALDVKAIKAALSGRWIGAFNALSPALKPALNAMYKSTPHVACPVHGGIHGDAFRLDKNSLDGAGYCNTCGSFLDGAAILSWVNGWSFRETLEQLDHYINGNNQTLSINDNRPVINKPPELNNADIEKRKKTVERIIKESSDQPYEPHLKYLESRGLKPVYSPCIRYHKGLPYYYKGKPLINSAGEWIRYPCIVGVFKHGGAVTGITKIYLTREGEKASKSVAANILAQYSEPATNVPIKLSYKIESLSGSAIRVGKIGESVNICEGLETGIALLNAGLDSMLIATTATLLASIDLPAHVKNVTIWADNDEAGINAANKLKSTIVDKSVDNFVDIKVPQKQGHTKLDWLDIRIC